MSGDRAVKNEGETMMLPKNQILRLHTGARIDALAVLPRDRFSVRQCFS